MSNDTGSDIYKDYEQRELGELYRIAIQKNDTVIMRLVNQIWLLQDLLNDEMNSHSRTRTILHNLRAQLKINPPSVEGGGLPDKATRG